MNPDDFDALLALVRAETEALRDANAAEEQFLDLHELGLRDGGHWGPDSDEYFEAIRTVEAFRAFPPTAWWKNDS